MNQQIKKSGGIPVGAVGEQLFDATGEKIAVVSDVESVTVLDGPGDSGGGMLSDTDFAEFEKKYLGSEEGQREIKKAALAYQYGIGREKVEEILMDRAPKHGEFEENARSTWAALEVFQRERNWPTLPKGKRHAIYMILHKIARIMAGDHDEPDHWDDIGGYAKCVADRIREPVVPYESDEVVQVMARGWNCTLQEARDRLKEWADGRRVGR